MPDEELGDDLVAQLGAEIFGFVRSNPEHFAARALVEVMAHEAAGDYVPRDERMMALTSVVQALRERRRP